jgi:hypothetical protein
MDNTVFAKSKLQMAFKQACEDDPEAHKAQGYAGV